MKADSKFDLEGVQFLFAVLCNWKRPFILEISFESDCVALPHNDLEKMLQYSDL